LVRSAGFARAGGPSRVDREAIHPTRPYECGNIALYFRGSLSKGRPADRRPATDAVSALRPGV